jgi:hypothetical protein
MKQTFFALIATVLLAPSCLGELIYGNSITHANPNQFDPFTAGQLTAPHVIGLGISRGTGVLRGSQANVYSASRWDSPVRDLNDYFALTLAPEAGFSVSFNKLEFNANRANSSSGPTSFEVRSSLDSFASVIASPTFVGTTVQLKNISLTAPQFQNIDSQVEFRIYAWGATTASGAFFIHDFAFDGAINAVPEPTSVVLASVAMIGIMAQRFRRNRCA